MPQDKADHEARQELGINAVSYGVLMERVNHLEKTVEEMRRDVGTLLDMANRSRGALWAMMGLAAAVGAFITWTIDHLK